MQSQPQHNMQNKLDETHQFINKFHSDMQSFVRVMEALPKTIKLNKQERYDLQRYLAPYKTLTVNPLRQSNAADTQEKMLDNLTQSFLSDTFQSSWDAYNRCAAQYNQFGEYMDKLQKNHQKEFAKVVPNSANPLGALLLNSLHQQPSRSSAVHTDFRTEAVKAIQAPPRYKMLLDEIQKAYTASQPQKNTSRIHTALNHIAYKVDKVNEFVRRVEESRQKGNTHSGQVYLSNRETLANNVLSEVTQPMQKILYGLNPQDKKDQRLIATLNKHLQILDYQDSVKHKLVSNHSNREFLITKLQKALHDVKAVPVGQKNKAAKKELIAVVEKHIEAVRYIDKQLAQEEKKGIKKPFFASANGRVAVPARPKSMPPSQKTMFARREQSLAPPLAPIPPRPKRLSETSPIPPRPKRSP